MRNIEITKKDYDSLAYSVARFYLNRVSRNDVNLYYLQFEKKETIKEIEDELEIINSDSNYFLRITDWSEAYGFNTVHELQSIIKELDLVVRLATEIGLFFSV